MWESSGGRDVIEIRRCESEPNLEELESRVLPRLSDIAGVERIIGVGSYYIPKNKPPNDLDYLLVLDFSFTDTDQTRSLGESLEVLRDDYSGEKFGKHVRSIVSIFLKDVDGSFLKGQDLFNWWDEDFGFTVKELKEETNRTRQYRTRWGEAPILWDRSDQ